ncbi:hypothetical protein ACKUVQ_05155 [Mycobacterium seoulense]|uniref:hypothetical protein n=1 Tax=Mycobacterium seoulense TaxID=386911 RepID=UPI003CF381F9
MKADRNSDDGEIRHEPVFRERWRDRQSAASRPGELIKQERWVDAGLVALSVLLAAGALAAGTVRIAQTEVKAEVGRPVSGPAGEVVVPQGRQRLISVLLPRLR